MLALLFATLAQGLQDGVFDKFGGKWVVGSVEQESKKGDVYSQYQLIRTLLILLNPISRCRLSVLKTCFIHEPANITGD